MSEIERRIYEDRNECNSKLNWAGWSRFHTAQIRDRLLKNLILAIFVRELNNYLHREISELRGWALSERTGIRGCSGVREMERRFHEDRNECNTKLNWAEWSRFHKGYRYEHFLRVWLYVFILLNISLSRCIYCTAIEIPQFPFSTLTETSYRSINSYRNPLLFPSGPSFGAPSHRRSSSSIWWSTRRRCSCWPPPGLPYSSSTGRSPRRSRYGRMRLRIG